MQPIISRSASITPSAPPFSEAPPNSRLIHFPTDPLPSLAGRVSQEAPSHSLAFPEPSAPDLEILPSASPERIQAPKDHTLKLVYGLIALGLILILIGVLIPPLVLPLALVGGSLILSGVSLHVMSIRPKTFPLRYQWNENNGYCGECCTIAAGLTYGQYFSQYDVRAIAAQKTPKVKPQTGCQYLLGENDQYAASQMRLNSIEWDNSKDQDPKHFLVWVKQMLAKGYPVTIGLYMNETLFEEPGTGDNQYDHIVSVLKVDSKSSDGAYHDDDVIYFSDNGLWGTPPTPPQYIFSCAFKDFMKTRDEANDPNSPIYSLCSTPGVGNFGQAITGVKGNTLPVSITTDVNYESPEIVDKKNDRPPSSPLQLTLTVEGLTPGVKYVLYKYNDEKKVPTDNFNQHADQAVKIWDIEIDHGSTYTLVDNIRSSDKAIYRAVPASSQV